MRRIDLTVEGNTHLGAGKIISESGDLTLDTGTLTHEDFSGSKQYEGFDVQANIDLTGKQQQPDQTSQPNNTAEGTYQLGDTRQEVRATVGPGEIIIRDKDKQAELEASGQTEDIASLNRDSDKAYEITKDKHVEIEYYLSDTSVKAAADALQEAGSTLRDALSAFVGTKSGLDAQTRQEALQLTGEIADSINSKEALQELRSCVGRQGFNLLDIFISKAYAGGVCERYSTAAINLCLEGFDKLRLAVVESGASGLEYFSKRIEQDPEGFEQIARLLDFMPSSLAMAPLENEIKAEIEKNGGDLDAINRMVNDFISRQTQAVENGEITPEVAASIAVAATIIVAKITPKSVRGKVVNKAIASSKTLFNAAKQKLGGTAGTSKFGFDSSNVESKLKGYLLDPLHPQNQTKANWFSQALGFNQSNWQELASQLRFDPKTAVATKATQYGQTYEQVIAITGTNGKTINTTFVFMKDNSGTVRLVTGIPAKK